jgi:hypothetical protein
MMVQIKRRNKIGMYVMTGRDMSSGQSCKTISICAAESKDVLEALARRCSWPVVAKWPLS